MFGVGCASSRVGTFTDVSIFQAESQDRIQKGLSLHQLEGAIGLEPSCGVRNICETLHLLDGDYFIWRVGGFWIATHTFVFVNDKLVSWVFYN